MILIPIFIALAFCVTYVALFFLMPRFFGYPRPPFTTRELLPMTFLIVASLVIYTISTGFPSEFWGNRFLHTIGGGFLIFVMCFLVAKNTNAPINKFQFFVFGILIVAIIGIANEIAELFLQQVTHLVFSTNIYDTWLDLLSNIIGALFTGALLTPFLRNNKKDRPV